VSRGYAALCCGFQDEREWASGLTNGSPVSGIAFAMHGMIFTVPQALDINGGYAGCS
jgi:hypothetical protein